jgi:hypothetical protein
LFFIYLFLFQIENKKKKRKRRRKNGTKGDNVSSTPLDKKIKTVDDDDQDDNDDNDNNDVHNPSYETITKTNTAFVPFDYNPAEYSKLEGTVNVEKILIFIDCIKPGFNLRHWKMTYCRICVGKDELRH